MDRTFPPPVPGGARHADRITVEITVYVDGHRFEFTEQVTRDAADTRSHADTYVAGTVPAYEKAVGHAADRAYAALVRLYPPQR
jgi:hypothetical protein